MLERRAIAGCYLASWTFAVLPLIGLFALARAMGGRSLAQLPGDAVRAALEMDVLAIWIVIGSLPMPMVAYWIWTEIRRRFQRGRRS